ncbi:hypothetical protein SALBM135S_06012 [Streptomyces alboniger]
MTGKTWNIQAGGPAVLAPVPALEGVLRDVLARAEAVVDRAAPEAALRRSRWMPQRKSAVRLVQGRPAALFTAKSVDLAKVSATQQRPKQQAQSARSAGGPR